MLINHIKIAFRYLKNNLSFTVINISGLTLGFFCFFLLSAYVFKEKSFDTNQDNVYRLLQKTIDENGTLRELAQSPPKVGSESKLLFDEIEDQTQIFYMGRINIGNNVETVQHQDIAFIDDNFLKVFDFGIVEGTKSDLINQPNGIILTQSSKEIYFGDQEALGKLLSTSYGDYPVVGVLDDFPENSHFENLVFISSQMASEVSSWYTNFMSSNWSRNELITYFKLLPNTNLNALGDKITQLAKTNYPVNQEFKGSFWIQSIKDIHLYDNDVEGEMNKNKGNALYVKLFFWIGVLILLVACFNYAGLLNISFIDRSKEIGVRQVVGAGKFHLLRQFLSESLVLISASMILAYLLLWLMQPLIQNWFSTSLNLMQVPETGLVLMFTIGLFLGLLSVIYPFWLIIRSGKTSSLKSTISFSSKLPFRRLMLTFQFVIVIAFLTGSIVFYQQMNFLKNREIGFNKEGLATVDINSRILRNQFEAIKNEFLRIPEVNAVAVSSRVPGEWKNIPIVKAKRKGQASNQVKDMLFIGADEDFVKTYNIDVSLGANFKGTPSDSTKVLINNSAAVALGLKNPIGEFIEIPFANFGGNVQNLASPFKAQVIGVLNDFQVEDFRTSIKPLVVGNWNNPIQSIDYYTLQVKTPNWASTIAAIKKVNDSFDPQTPAELNILSDQFARFFKQDMEHFKLLNFFSVVVVFLACMGLFATSAFVARSRTKEIGIRKVLGSTVTQLMYLLSRDFIKLTIVGWLVAIPISWYFLQGWLSGFAYHINFKWWMIGLAGVACLLITVCIVGFQSIKAAIVNPVKSLRTE
ncbi:ABC transporter permease [uncultured Maribacter sp.]|uniref:ABC transporter permease n=1 Tax=uncultured Maribacter sp. TaxID=431308 RepID=UPI002602BAE6|nr:ABC transporter permease [uncultured Maribacter sp.]